MSETDEKFIRTQMLLGQKALEKLSRSRVAVFGVGGVGGHLAEALARSGVGAIDLFDNDTVSMSNINRQAAATVSTVGEYKADVMRQRILDINPDCKVGAYKMFYTVSNADEISLNGYGYVADAIDTVSSKIELAVRCDNGGIPIISAMGAGNKLDPTQFEVADIYDTEMCPLARIMRKELRARGVSGLKVVYSREPAAEPLFPIKNGDSNKPIPGSVAFVPSVAGLIMAGEIIKDLIKE